jgi:hypothetical protein
MLLRPDVLFINRSMETTIVSDYIDSTEDGSRVRRKLAKAVKRFRQVMNKDLAHQRMISNTRRMISRLPRHHSNILFRISSIPLTIFPRVGVIRPRPRGS